MLRVILIFLRATVLQTGSPTECIDNPMFCVNSPTKPTLAVFSPTKRWFYSTEGLSTQWSTLVYRKSYCLQDYQYTSQDQCVDSPTLFRTIDTLFKTSVS